MPRCPSCPTLFGLNDEFVLMYLIRRSGRALPKAIALGLVSSGLAAFLIWLKKDLRMKTNSTDGGQGALAVMVFLGFLAFMIAMRTMQAMTRYWECADFLKEAEGYWLSATSGILSLSSSKVQKGSQSPDEIRRVERFRWLLVTCISLFFSSSLSDLSETGRVLPTLQHSGVESLNYESLSVLESLKQSKSEVVLQWIQRLILDQISQGVIPASPALLAGNFELMSRGHAQLKRAEKVNDIGFPFLYAALYNLLLLCATLLVPAASAYVMETEWFGACASFFTVFFLWCLDFLAVEIEHPFGNFANSIYLEDEVSRFNADLVALVNASSCELPHIPLYKTSVDRKMETQEVEACAEQRRRSLEYIVDETDDYDVLLNDVPAKVRPNASKESTGATSGMGSERQDWGSMFSGAKTAPSSGLCFYSTGDVRAALSSAAEDCATDTCKPSGLACEQASLAATLGTTFPATSIGGLQTPSGLPERLLPGTPGLWEPVKSQDAWALPRDPASDWQGSARRRPAVPPPPKKFQSASPGAAVPKSDSPVLLAATAMDTSPVDR